MELSADGYTLAVASSEASNASGVNGDQADNSSHWSGAVYVFRRRGNTWHQEAYLKAGVNQPEQFFGSDGSNLGYEALAIERRRLDAGGRGAHCRMSTECKTRASCTCFAGPAAPGA